MWLLVVTTCALFSDDCVVQKTRLDDKKECIQRAEAVQNRLDLSGNTRFVIVCRRARQEGLREVSDMWYNESPSDKRVSE